MRRYRIVHDLSHGMYNRLQESPHLHCFPGMGRMAAGRLGCLIRGRLGHFLDTAWPPARSEHQGDGFNPACPCLDCEYVRNSQALADDTDGAR